MPAVSRAQVRFMQIQLERAEKGLPLSDSVQGMTIDEIRELAETPTNSLPEKVGKAGDMEIIKGFREESTLKVVGAGGKTVYFAYRHDTAITGGWGLWVSIRGKGDIPEGTIGLVGAEIEELSRFVQDILAAHPDRVYRAKKWTKEAQR